MSPVPSSPRTTHRPGWRERYPMPDPTPENFGIDGPDLQYVDTPPALRCPWCSVPFEADDDRYFMSGCIDCGWRRRADA